jgi:hypothetical protein
LGSQTNHSFREETDMVNSNLQTSQLHSATSQPAQTAATGPTLCRAKSLEPNRRSELALEVLAGTRSTAAVAREEGVSRKFVASQVDRARQAVQDAFEPSAPDVRDAKQAPEDGVLFTIPVTADLIRRVVLALILYCHSSYRGALELLRNVLGIPISIGTIHNIVQQAADNARQINERVDLSSVRIGAHDEIFQNGKPVLVGCDVKSTYCYLLSLEDRRDADTWALRMLELRDHRWNPEATIADGGRGLRAGQELAVPGLPCRGDVFHALMELGKVAVYLENRAYGTITACAKEERQLQRAQNKGRQQILKKTRQKVRRKSPETPAEQSPFKTPDQSQENKCQERFAKARQEESRAIFLAQDVSLLVVWLRDDVLTVAGPDLATRQGLFDFIIAELKRLEPQCPHRFTPVISSLRNQRDDLLAFVAELDQSLAALAAEHQVAVDEVRDVLQLLAPTTTKQWQAEAALRKRLGERFYAIRTAVEALADHTVRASSVIENINSRLRNYFFLRRSLGWKYLDLLRFYLNNHRFLRSDRPERVGHSPYELLTGQQQPHWLDQLVRSSSNAA